MHHAFFDRYSDGLSPLHRFDVRLKLIVAFVLVLAIASMPPEETGRIIICLPVLLILWIAAQLPLTYLLKRLALLLPFVLIMSAALIWARRSVDPVGAYHFALHVLLKAGTAIIALTLVTSTTPFPRLLSGLRWFRVPGILTALLAFLYRFLYILIDEFERLSIGRRSRAFGHGLALAWRSRAWMLGTFLIRSIERSERIYQAMCARGWIGQLETPDHFTRPCVPQIVAAVLAVAAAIALRWGVYP